MGSRFQSHLPLFRRFNVGVYGWGLVLGRTQTNRAWSTMNNAPDPNPTEWQHDMMLPDGTAYDTELVAVIREQVGEDLLMKSVEMTPESMQDLHDRGLIIRMGPRALDARPGETLGRSLCESAEAFGPPKRITATVGREELTGLAAHPDNEEFLLIADQETSPMYLAIALCMRGDFEEKVKTGNLVPKDLVLLRCRYNDPEVSFFVLRNGMPHSAAIVDLDKSPATFYIAESGDLPRDLLEMRKYRLKVDPR